MIFYYYYYYLDTETNNLVNKNKFKIKSINNYYLLTVTIIHYLSFFQKIKLYMLIIKTKFFIIIRYNQHVK